MDLTIEIIERIYKNYGFEVKRHDNDIACFLYKKGRYFGVDIVQLNNEADLTDKMNLISKGYSEAGYAVFVRKFSSIVDVEIELFKSFFSYDLTIKRLRKKYSDFVSKQNKNLLSNKYEYIESPFDLYDRLENSGDIGLLDSLKTIIDRSHLS
ncbi:MAG: hypothetical protein IPK03_14970 [Bacteroidetes bacterium]|nr:hypothetical protein [Bacteroidota bacterium]